MLGLIWCCEDDTLSVAVHEVAQDKPSIWTRRSLLHCVASIFDPLGLAAPLVLPGKIYLQRSWREDSGWDQPLSNALSQSVDQWWGELTQPKFKVPRWIGCSPSDPVTVHAFGDASEKAYGCCVYVVVGCHSNLILAKTKVAPLNAPTLARLELQAACLAARQVSFAIAQLRVIISEVHAWSDSLTVLHWINSEPYRWKTWVRNRVATIRDISAKHSIVWHHCPGIDNPADLASRGSEMSALKSVSWLQGPNWLPQPGSWPECPDTGLSTDSVIEARVAFVACMEASGDWWSRFSKWTRLMGVVSRILSWQPKKLLSGELRRKTELVLIRTVQQELFAEELEVLKAKKSLSKDSKLYQLNPFLDEEQLLRVGGRLQNSEMSYDAKHPVILGKHHITLLLLRHTHIMRHHEGVESMLSFLRQRYWIVGVRRLLRSVKSACVACRRYDAKSADEVSPPLPCDRVTFRSPFSLCGIDYAGPLLVRNRDSSSKVWIALFVCGLTRAIHLEIVSSLSCDDFLLAFRRFVSRHCMPCRIRSDNGTTFVAAAKVVKVDWVFNPPSAPWFGGFYEILVSCVKRPLRKVLGRALVSLSELQTLLCEIECLVNQRPLTHVGDTDPLTPAKLTGKDLWNTGSDTIVEAPISKHRMSQRLQYLRTMKEHMISRWKEYIVSLQNYHAGKSSPVTVGDVVFVVDDRKKRREWKTALVKKLYVGKDGRCRVALLSTGGQSTMTQPIRRLVPMEVGVSSQIDSLSPDNSESRPIVRTRTRTIKPPDWFQAG